MESVTFVTEPLLHRDFVQFEIVVPILERLSHKYDITLAAPRIAPEVQEELERRNIRPADGGAFFPPIRRSRDEIPSYISSWARDAIWGRNRKDIERALEGIGGIRVNVSMTTAIDADAWLIESRPLSLGLEDMRRGVNLPLSVALAVANPFVGRLDLQHLLDAGRRARERYSATQHVADWFGSKGLPVKGITPLYYRPAIHRTTPHPSRDFIFVYVGKETDSAALRMLLETGLPVTMFGSKSVGWVKNRLRLELYPHARLLGHISDEELSDLYSNARFTAFPFTEEPFGLVPLESMACGTPVLTYGVQGPGETVLDGRTGWLVRSPQEFVRRAAELWKAGSPSTLMVDQCLVRARMYHLDSVRASWDRVIESAFERSGEGIPTRRPVSWVRPEPSLGVGAFPTVRSFAVASGPDQIIPRPDPVQPTVPLTNFMPSLIQTHSSLSRSGGHYDFPEPDRKRATTEDDLSEDPRHHAHGPESPPGSGSSRGRAPSRSAATDGTPSTTP